MFSDLDSFLAAQSKIPNEYILFTHKGLSKPKH